MKRSLAALGGLIVALLLAAGPLWWRAHRETEALRQGYLFDSTRVSGVRNLKVAYRLDSMELIRIDSRWKTAEDSFPVDTLALRKALGWLLGTRMREKVTDSADARSLWDYGLNPEDARRVEWTWSDGSKVRLVFGKTSSLDYNYTYWMWGDPARGRAVYRTPGNQVWDVSPRASAWKEKAFWPPFAASQIRSLTVDWKDASGVVQHYRIARRDSGGFRLQEPFEGPVSAETADRLFEKATQFTADDFGVDLDPDFPNVFRSRVTSEDPAVEIRIVLRDGTEHALKAGPVYMGLEYTQHPAHRSLVWVFKWRYDYFKKRPEDL